MVDTLKEFAPILTSFIGLLIAFLSGFFFRKNKQTEYSMKIAEAAIEKVYNRVLVIIEESQRHTNRYEGLTFQEIQDIKVIFSDQRHLVDDMLWDMIWQFEEEYRFRQEFNDLSKAYRGTSFSPLEIDRNYDQNRKFLERLLIVRKKHLKNLGFSTYMKFNVFEIMMMSYEKLQKDVRRYRMRLYKKKMYKKYTKL